MNYKAIALLALGFGLRALSKPLELRGDLAPFAESGVSWERLMFHSAALGLTVAALACFVAAGISLFRKKPVSS